MTAAEYRAEEASKALADALKEIPREQLRMLSFSSLRSIAGPDFEVVDVEKAARKLMSQDILSKFYIFTDSLGDEFEVPVEEVAAARAERFFVHPDTGEEVREFESFLTPYYQVP